MKICVYAICKNQSDVFKRSYESKEADEIYVFLGARLSGGWVDSKKNLVLYLRKKRYEDFAFDEARDDAFQWLRVTQILWYQLT